MQQTEGCPHIVPEAKLHDLSEVPDKKGKGDTLAVGTGKHCSVRFEARESGKASSRCEIRDRYLCFVVRPGIPLRIGQMPFQDEEPLP
jgi:hypothetical protein